MTVRSPPSAAMKSCSKLQPCTGKYTNRRKKGGISMTNFFARPFGHERRITKEDIGKNKRSNKNKADNMGQTLKRIWQSMRREPKRRHAIISLVVETSLLSLVGPCLVGRIVDYYFIPREFNGLFRVLMILLASYVLLSATTFIQAYLMVGLSQRTIYNLRHHL